MGPTAAGLQEPPFLSGLPGVCLSTGDPQLWAELVSRLLPVRICEPLQNREAFRIRTALVDLGAVAAVATEGSPITV